MKTLLELINDVSDVTKLNEWVEGLAEDCHLTAEQVFQLNLALEEAVVNVMQYAYPDQQGMPVRLSAEPKPDGIHFLLEDEGIPFDPTQAKDPDITLSAEERSIGGLGILLVRQFMTDITYHYQDGCNRLEMFFPS